jgi:hypothetical protein
MCYKFFSSNIVPKYSIARFQSYLINKEGSCLQWRYLYSPALGFQIV